ncbi:MAG: hypothetical protein PHG40_02275 [Candidatus Omnitrophica bacterium]|nr:hypothetical protein [Candidatus Omnitrophota bacterium]
MNKKQRYIFNFFLLAIALSLPVSALSAIPFDLSLEQLEVKPEGDALQVEPIERPDVQYAADGQRDPFDSPITENKEATGNESSVTENEPLPSWMVQGLVWGGRFPQAIINNKVVKTGDMIEGAQVVSIEKSGVKLLFKGKSYSLSSPASGGSQENK